MNKFILATLGALLLGGCVAVPVYDYGPGVRFVAPIVRVHPVAPAAARHGGYPDRHYYRRHR